MLVCSDPACGETNVSHRNECPRCGGKVVRNDSTPSFQRMRELTVGWNGYDGKPPSDDTIRRVEAYLIRLGTYRPDRIAPSQAGGGCYGAICLTWKGTHGRRACLEFYDGGGLSLLLSSPTNIQVLSYLSEQDGGAVHAIQAYLHGE